MAVTLEAQGAIDTILSPWRSDNFVDLYTACFQLGQLAIRAAMDEVAKRAKSRTKSRTRVAKALSS